MQRWYLNFALMCVLPWPVSLHAQGSTSPATVTLAVSCAACHGPQGNSLGITPTLAALNKEYFIQRLQGFKNGTITSSVMHHHAKGLTDEEITALASYFASQPRQTPTAAPKQSFKGAQ